MDMTYSVAFAEKYILKFKDYKNLSVDEHKKLLKIRNKKEVLKASRNSKRIELKEHLEWVKNLPKNKKYFAVFVNNEIIGGVNYTFKEDIVTDWGIFFADFIKPFFTSVITFVFIEKMFEKYDILYSEVKKDNKRALKFNQFFGIEIYAENKDFYKLKLTKEKWNNYKRNLNVLIKCINKGFINE
jgi:UDP-4-amino-4,6-dideoxy-N-acetyl-beta-L-altrosamine N-acetyltransferase